MLLFLSCSLSPSARCTLITPYRPIRPKPITHHPLFSNPPSPSSLSHPVPVSSPNQPPAPSAKPTPSSSTLPDSFQSPNACSLPRSFRYSPRYSSAPAVHSLSQAQSKCLGQVTFLLPFRWYCLFRAVRVCLMVERGVGRGGQG